MDNFVSAPLTIKVIAFRKPTLKYNKYLFYDNIPIIPIIIHQFYYQQFQLPSSTLIIDPKSNIKFHVSFVSYKKYRRCYKITILPVTDQILHS